jgi:hypothetical protein
VLDASGDAEEDCDALGERDTLPDAEAELSRDAENVRDADSDCVWLKLREGVPLRDAVDMPLEETLKQRDMLTLVQPVVTALKVAKAEIEADTDALCCKPVIVACSDALLPALAGALTEVPCVRDSDTESESEVVAVALGEALGRPEELMVVEIDRDVDWVTQPLLEALATPEVVGENTALALVKEFD